jgi:Cu/Ag efflux protein CusF
LGLPLLSLTAGTALHTTLSITALMAGLLANTAGWAQTPSAIPATSTPAATVATDLPWISGDVRRVDRAAGKVTIKHAAITNLDMPPMTMVFALADPALMADLQVGEHIEFSVDQVQGQYTVLRWRQQK